MANKLTDFLQGASNAAASNLSAPVDGVAWLLRKAGMDIKNPVMGSDWMAQRGLTREPKNRLAGILGESLGGVAPMLAAAKAPQIAKGLLQGADNLAAPRTMNPQTGAVVWHGSPHKFDKFDSSKIGTGEGAQAYGHGLYLADNKAVATEYKNALGAGRGAGGDDALARILEAAGGDSAKAATIARQRVQYANTPDGKEKFERIAQKLESGFDPRGALYKVDLPDEHIAKMLDWDKPLSAQHADVQSTFGRFSANGDITGREAYRAAHEEAIRAGKALPAKEKERQAVEAMRKAGIPGIRYLDGGSRTTGGTSNYVVFPGNEGLLSIMERNGQPVNALKSMMVR